MVLLPLSKKKKKISSTLNFVRKNMKAFGYPERDTWQQFEFGTLGNMIFFLFGLSNQPRKIILRGSELTVSPIIINNR